MGKKPRLQLPPKHEKKPQIHSLLKILRPKVYITDSSNFKNLVQQLTGNGSSPPPSIPTASPPTAPMYIQDDSLDWSFDSSCFNTGSPDPFNYVVDEKIDFLSQYMDLESLLMGMDSVPNNYGSCSYGMAHQQEVCLYDYDIPTFI